MNEALRVDVSDRITIASGGAGSLCLSGDFFVERVTHMVGQDHAHMVRLQCSPIVVHSWAPSAPTWTPVEVVVGTGGTYGDTAIPGQAASLVGTGAGGIFVVDWTLPSTGGLLTLDQFALQYSPNSDHSSPVATIILGKQQHYEFIDPNKTYYFQVAAHNMSGTASDAGTVSLGATGWGPWKTYVVAASSGDFTGAPPPAALPGSVNSFDVSIQNGNDFVGAWAPPSTGGPFDDYLLEYSPSPGFTNDDTLISVPLGTVLCVDGREWGRTYYFRISAHNLSGITGGGGSGDARQNYWHTSGWGPWTNFGSPTAVTSDPQPVSTMDSTFQTDVTNTANNASAASGSASSASSAKVDALAAKADALLAAADALDSATGAGFSENDAWDYRNTALDAKIAAEAAQVSCEAAIISCDAAKDSAESARDAAASAESGAASAQSAAGSYADAASSAKDSAVSAKDSAESAAESADSAKSAAESAQSAAESAQSAAESAASAAAGSASDAQTTANNFSSDIGSIDSELSDHEGRIEYLEAN
jgi:hypothetical protein